MRVNPTRAGFFYKMEIVMQTGKICTAYILQIICPQQLTEVQAFIKPLYGIRSGFGMVGITISADKGQGFRSLIIHMIGSGNVCFKVL